MPYIFQECMTKLLLGVRLPDIHPPARRYLPRISPMAFKCTEGTKAQRGPGDACSQPHTAAAHRASRSASNQPADTFGSVDTIENTLLENMRHLVTKWPQCNTLQSSAFYMNSH